MDEFKIKIEEYLSKYFDSRLSSIYTHEKLYEDYVESDYSFQSTIIFKYVNIQTFSFFMVKRNSEFIAQDISFTRKEIEIMSSNI